MDLDNATRARIARGWTSSSLDQTAYAAQFGISTRTLRDWVCRYGGGRRPQAQLRAAIVASIAQLQSVLAALDAEAAGAAGADADSGVQVMEHDAERHAVPAAPPMPAASVSPEDDATAMMPTVMHAAGRHPQAPASAVDSVTRRIPEKSNGTVDLEALRNRARHLRAARAASGAARRNPFVDWDSK